MKRSMNVHCPKHWSAILVAIAAMSVTFVPTKVGATTMSRPTQPAVIRDAVASADWISKALLSSGYRADFSLESLKEIDRFFDEQAPDGTPKPDGLLSQDLGARIFALGSYVGEVIRRKTGGQWHGDDADKEAEVNISVQLDDGTIRWPVQRVMKRFRNGPEDGIWAYGVLAQEAPSSKH
ncbi:MAG: hypothetical protein HY243_00160 [Proteobacteria bacterium]|nr:hypothetical protein [Pseudomonadota bacterium]